MKEQTGNSVTALLRAWGQGDADAGERLFRLVYADLRRRARGLLRREQAGHTLQTTALVHEAYLRLVGQQDARWRNRSQFFGVACHVMRRVLVDAARRRLAAKRGGAALTLTTAEGVAAPEGRPVDLVELDQALEELAAIDRRQARIVEMRFFAGLSIGETAEMLGVSAATVKREWSLAKAWLFRRLEGRRGPAKRTRGPRAERSG